MAARADRTVSMAGDFGGSCPFGGLSEQGQWEAHPRRSFPLVERRAVGMRGLHHDGIVRATSRRLDSSPDNAAMLEFVDLIGTEPKPLENRPIVFTS